MRQRTPGGSPNINDKGEVHFFLLLIGNTLDPQEIKCIFCSSNNLNTLEMNRRYRLGEALPSLDKMY